MPYDEQISRNWRDAPSARLIEFEGHWYEARAFAAIAQRLTRELAALPPTTAIGLVARNRIGPVAGLAALLALGRPITMIHAAQSHAAIAGDIARLGLAAVIADPTDWQTDTLVAAEASGTTAIAIGGMAGRLELTICANADGAGGRAREVAANVALELLSSGTTGPPKRVPLTAATFEQAAADAQLIYADDGLPPPVVVFHPISNIAGLTFLIPMLWLRHPVCLMERFSLPLWLELVRRHRPRRASLPPAVLRDLLDNDIARDALSSFVSIGVGAAALDPDLQARFEARYCLPVLISYGATEFCGVVANWTPDMHDRFAAAKRGSVGRARPGVALRVVDPASGSALATGEIGRLEARIDRLGPDWRGTTDLASIDEDGFLFLHGREDGAINRGGFKVLPDTIAAVLRDCPGIRDAAVIGVKDDRLGMVPVGAVETAAGRVVPSELVLAHARQRLLAYQVPARILVTDRLPRNASLKVDLVALRRLLAETA